MREFELTKLYGGREGHCRRGHGRALAAAAIDNIDYVNVYVVYNIYAAAHPHGCAWAAAAHPLAALGPPRLAAPAKNLNYEFVTKNIYSPQRVN